SAVDKHQMRWFAPVLASARNGARCGKGGAAASTHFSGGTRWAGSARRGAGVGDGFGEVEEAAAELLVGNAVIGAHELQCFAPHHGIGSARRRVRSARRGAASASRAFRPEFVEEERDRDIKDAAQLKEPAGADPIGAALVFLHLLKGEADGV